MKFRPIAWKLLTIALLFGTCNFLTAQIVINEVMADNQNAVANEGIYPDWVELYNPGTNTVDISNWSISDSITTPTKFIFPPNTTIAAGAYLVVWLDNLTNAPGLHTGFTLSSKTDDVSIYTSTNFGGAQQDLVMFGIQIQDLSIGRVPDGAANAFTLTFPTPGGPNQPVPLGVVDNLKINELMARPPGNDDDWFELYNPETNAVLISGLVWTDLQIAPTNRAIPNLSFIAAGGFIQFIADDLDNRDADHVDFQLGGGGDRIILYRTNRTTVIDRIDFGNQTNNVSHGRLPDGGTNLVFFAPGRSTPGASNFQLLTDIIINEVLTHTDPPLEDAIELYNPTTNAVDISGWWLSNSRDDPKKFRIPTNTVVQPGGYVVFYEWPGSIRGFNSNGFGTNRSFTLNSSRGDQVYLHTADAEGNLTFFRTSRDFGAAENGVSFGRYVTSDGGTDFVAMSRRTFGVDNPVSTDEFRMGTGLTNASPKVGPIVINEIMYHPPDLQGTNDNDLDEYVEIYNAGPTNVLFYDPIIYPFADGRTNTWHLRGVVDFDFPTNVSLPAGGYLLVVNFDPMTNAMQLDAFRMKYSFPAGVQIFGPYGSRLDNGGGSVELNRPDVPQPPGRVDEGLVPQIRVDRVNYDDNTPWPVEPDGDGAALQRVHALGYGNDPTNWIAAAPSPGGQFVPNTPPAILPIADVVTNEIRLITLQVMATDTNVPAQSLTYSIGTNAPAGATIDTSGVFRWRPREEHGPGTFPITVRVTDNGIPAQTSAVTFDVIVNEVNRAPCFQTREQWIKADTTWSFMTARDLDLPPQLLTFSLVGSAPTNLMLDSNTGAVTWTPTDAQVGDHRVTIEAFDDGPPNLTNSFTYTIHVVSSTNVLVWPDITFANGVVNITWEATIGKTYLIEYTENLAEPVAWQPLRDFIGADNTPMSIPDLVGFGQRFYRISQRD